MSRVGSSAHHAAQREWAGRGGPRCCTRDPATSGTGLHSTNAPDMIFKCVCRLVGINGLRTILKEQRAKQKASHHLLLAGQGSGTHERCMLSKRKRAFVDESASTALEICERRPRVDHVSSDQTGHLEGGHEKSMENATWYTIEMSCSFLKNRGNYPASYRCNCPHRRPIMCLTSCDGQPDATIHDLLVATEALIARTFIPHSTRARKKHMSTDF